MNDGATVLYAVVEGGKDDNKAIHMGTPGRPIEFFPEPEVEKLNEAGRKP